MTGELTHASLFRLCRGAQADGLILMQIALEDWRADLLRENSYPFVLIGGTANNEGLTLHRPGLRDGRFDAGSRPSIASVR
jgi:DNA-binding LacI/PurR family transcriptional regulator